MPSLKEMKQVYDKHLNLKLAAEELGMKWQTLYYHLNANNHPVIGNKALYGSGSDKLSAATEKHFQMLVPFAIDSNKKVFQSKFDFYVGSTKIDVKSSRLNSAGKGDSMRWAFSIKKQQSEADYFVCFGWDNDEIKYCWLIPGEIAREMSTISIANRGSKWDDFRISESDLVEFFEMLSGRSNSRKVANFQ